MARAIEQLKQAMEACELGALTLPDQVDALMDAARAILQEVSTLTPPNELRMINADKLAKRIAGHSNYHGDSILAAIYCAAEGKENDAPIRPIETPPNEPLTLDELREMKDKPAYLNVFDPLLESGWHIIKAVTEDKIIFRGWQTVYVPIDGMGIDYNLYRRPPERQEDT